MNLREYLFYSNMTVKDFAKIADFNNAFLSRILNGKHMPSAKTLRAIERVTNGKVRADTILAPTKLPEGWEDVEKKMI